MRIAMLEVEDNVVEDVQDLGMEEIGDEIELLGLADGIIVGDE